MKRKMPKLATAKHWWSIEIDALIETLRALVQSHILPSPIGICLYLSTAHKVHFKSSFVNRRIIVAFDVICLWNDRITLIECLFRRVSVHRPHNHFLYHHHELIISRPLINYLLISIRACCWFQSNRHFAAIYVLRVMFQTQLPLWVS